MLNNFLPNQKFDSKMRENFIDDICKKYSFIKCDILGKSAVGRNIHILKIGSDNNPALFVGAFHGMEWLTSLLLLTFIENISNLIYNNILFDNINLKSFLDFQGLYVIPCINPDGVEISIHGASSAGLYENLVRNVMNYKDTSSWQANARGVDLNHNFDANWQELRNLEQQYNINGPSPTRYGGPEPVSEPETRLLVDLCESISFRHAIAFHSQGEEIYWKYGNNTPKISELIGFVMSKLSGYTLASPQGLAVGGGFKDWFIDRFSRPAFTVEIGKGKNPLPIQDINPIYSKLENMLVYCSVV